MQAALGTKRCSPFLTFRTFVKIVSPPAIRGPASEPQFPKWKPLIDFAAYAHRAAERFMTHSLLCRGHEGILLPIPSIWRCPLESGRSSTAAEERRGASFDLKRGRLSPLRMGSTWPKDGNRVPMDSTALPLLKRTYMPPWFPYLRA
jgi:hypothetical protein